MVNRNTIKESQVSEEMSKVGRIRKVANLRMLVSALIVLAITLPGAYAWHAYQVRRTSTALLEQAQTLEEEGKWGEAAGYLDRYLQVMPNDMSVMIRLTEDFDKFAKNKSDQKISAIQRYQILLGKMGDALPAEQTRLKSRLVTLLLETRQPRYTEAETLAEDLIESDNENPAAWRAKALTLYNHHQTGTLPAELKSVGSVSEGFERAVKLNPTDTVLNRRLARIYREGDRELLAEDLTEDERKQKADAQIDALVSASPDDANVYFIRYRYRRIYQLDGAEADLKRAIELGPDNFDVLIAAGEAAQSEARRLRKSRKLPKVEAEAKYKEKYKQADQHYRQAIEIKPKLRMGYVRLGNLYREQSQLDDAISTWREGLQRSSEQSLELNKLNTLLADVLIESGQTEQAEKALDRIDGELNIKRQRAYTPLLSLWEAKQNLRRGRWHLAKGEFAEAIPLLQQTTIDPEGSPEEAALAAQAWLMTGRAFGALGQWEEAAQAYEKAIQVQPEYAIAYKEVVAAWLKAGQADRATKAQEKLERLHASNPKDPRPLLVLADLALRQSDYKSLEKWETQLKLAEGENGSAWKYYRARRLLVKAKDSRDPLLKEASDLEAKIRVVKSEWSGTFLLAGLIAERKGELDGAIAAYGRAMELGDRSVFIYERLVRLLIGAGQIETAEKLLAAIASWIPLSNDLTTAKMMIYSQQGKPDAVLEVAKKALAARPNDPKQHLLVGRLFESQKKPAEAEDAFRKATELAPDNLIVLGELFRFYVASKQQKKAEQVLATIAANDKLDEVSRTLAVATCHQLLGRLKEAETAYRNAIKIAPDNLVVQGRFIRFLLKQPVKEKWEEATRILEKLAEKNPDSAPTRRALARVKASMGSAKDRKEASDLLATLADNPEQATDADHRDLAGLYESQNDIESARKEYLKLVDRDNAPPRDIAYYVHFLLRNKLAAEAAPWLDRLEKQAPEDAGIVALRVRWLHAQGREDEIGDHVEKMVERLLKTAGDDQNKQMQIFGAAGNLYVTVGQFAAAEKHFRKVLKKSPQAIIPLSNTIAKQGRRLEALKLCVEADKNNSSPYPAIAISSILMSAKSSEEELALGEPILNKAVETYKDNAILLSNIAVLRITQGHTGKAAGIYQKMLDSQPENTMTLNNLATIYGEDPETREKGLELIGRAIEIAGPQPNLLDTKATILLYNDKPSAAVELLEKATTAANPDPRYFFHLALAHQKSGNLDKAKEAYGKAEKSGLKNHIMTTKDLESLAQLERDLKKK